MIPCSLGFCCSFVQAATMYAPSQSQDDKVEELTQDLFGYACPGGALGRVAVSSSGV